MRRIASVGFLLIVVTAGAWWLLRPAGPDLPRPAATAPSAVVTAGDLAGGATEAPGADAERAVESATAASAPAATTAAATAPVVMDLPSADLPLRESLPALIEAHRGGHVPATLRLLKELTDCQRYQWSSMRMDMMIAFEDSPRMRRGGERLQAAMQEAAQTVATLNEHCQDVPLDLDQALLFEVQRRAAESGDLAGQLAFALVPAMNLENALEQLDRVTLYRELAPQFLQQALQQGSGQAVAAFMEGYEHISEGWRGHAGRGTEMQQQAARRLIEAMQSRTPLQQVLGEDLALAYRYAVLCKRACNGTDQARAESAAARLSPALDPAQRRSAEDAAAELYDAHFAARKRPDDIDLNALRNAVSGFRR